MGKTLGSLFDGSGTSPLAGLKFGIQPSWASEVEPFPIRVTTKRIPQMKHLGDLNRINGASVPPVDVLTGGCCCQDLSCDGRRAGLHGERSGLFFQMTRIVREMLDATNGAFPKALCIENVPGLLSSNQGRDFCEVMDNLGALGFVSDPNILCASDHGVAQRRKRVYIASINRKFYNADYFKNMPRVRDKRMEKSVKSWGGETFYGITSRPHTPVRQKLSEILQIHVDPRYHLSAEACIGILRRADNRGKELPPILRYALEFQARLEVGGDPGLFAPLAFEPGAASRIGGHCWSEIVGTLRADAGDNLTSVVYDARGNGDGKIVNTITGDHNNRVTDYTTLAVTPSAYALQGNMIGREDKNGPQGSGINLDISFSLNTLDRHAVAYGISSYMSNAMLSSNPHSGVYEAETSRTLDTSGIHPGCNQGGICVVESHALALDCRNHAASEISGTLQAKSGGGHSLNYINPVAVAPLYIVRRLLPSECAALQGFPTDYCSDLGTKNPTVGEISFWEDVFETQRRILGKSTKEKSWKQITKWLADPHSDSAEYKMWGNGCTKPVVEFVMEGIAACL